MHWVPISYFPVKLLNMLTLSSKVHQIINCLESDFLCNCDVSMLCCSMRKHIPDNGSNYGSIGQSDLCGCKAFFILSKMAHENNPQLIKRNITQD